MAVRRAARVLWRAVRRALDLAAWSFTVELTVPVTLLSMSLRDANQEALAGAGAAAAATVYGERWVDGWGGGGG